MKLNELWNQPEQVKWEAKQPNLWQGVFTINSLPYGIDIFKVDKKWNEKISNLFVQHKELIETHGAWEVLFYLHRSKLSNSQKDELKNKFGPGFEYVLLQTGNSVAVLSTVIHAISEFVDQVNPEILYFSAGENSRIKLYDRIIKSLGYHAEKASMGGSTLFLIIRRDET